MQIHINQSQFKLSPASRADHDDDYEPERAVWSKFSTLRLDTLIEWQYVSGTLLSLDPSIAGRDEARPVEMNLLSRDSQVQSESQWHGYLFAGLRSKRLVSSSLSSSAPSGALVGEICRSRSSKICLGQRLENDLSFTKSTWRPLERRSANPIELSQVTSACAPAEMVQVGRNSADDGCQLKSKLCVSRCVRPSSRCAGRSLALACSFFSCSLPE